MEQEASFIANEYSTFTISQYLRESLAGWRWKTITTIGLLPWTLLGGYSIIQSQSDSRLPQFFSLMPSTEWWIIVLLMWLLVTISFILILFSVGSFSVVKNVELDTNNRTANHALLLKYYENRMGLPTLLSELSNTCASLINKQRLPKLPERKLTFREKMKVFEFIGNFVMRTNIFKWCMLGLLGLITLGNSRALLKQKAVLITSIMFSVNIELSRYNLGAIPASKNKDYIICHEKVKVLEVGLPPKLIKKIDTSIKIINSMNCMLLLRPERNIWKQAPIFKRFKSSMPYLMEAVGTIERTLVGEISQDINSYLGV